MLTALFPGLFEDPFFLDEIADAEQYQIDCYFYTCGQSGCGNVKPFQQSAKQKDGNDCLRNTYAVILQHVLPKVVPALEYERPVHIEIKNR